MTVSRRLAAAIVSVALLAGAFAATAGAAEATIRLISKDVTEQADFASEPAISADGRYVAFRAAIHGRQGIFREDLSSGAVEPVLAGSQYLFGSPGADAAAPAISADGRYVSFTTRAQLDAADDTQPQSSDVYVADMSAAPPSFRLVSAADQCCPGASPPPCGLLYEGAGGSQASGRVALSADGGEVAFVTTAVSNLVGGPGGTPALQVVLRDLGSCRSTLVSARRDAIDGQMTGLPVVGGSAVQRPSGIAAGAALSADGTTVAWLGANLAQQVPLAAGETVPDGEFGEYDEPLWRRVGDGPQAPIRRIVGGEGGPFPELSRPTPSGESPSATGECASLPTGWLPAKAAGLLNPIPGLSADGWTVALLGEPNGFANAFLVDMRSGGAGSGAVRQLTREVPIFNPCLANEPANVTGAGDVLGVAISAGGSHVAFTTRRQLFPLAPPSLIGTPPTSVGLTELYEADLAGGTLERVTHGASAGAPSQGPPKASGLAGASSPSFSADGRTLAFASDAANLVPADANEGSDVFVLTASAPGERPGAVDISPPPPATGTKPSWRLIASAISRRDGSVRLAVLVPAAGRLSARAKAELRVGARRRRVASARRRAGGDELVLLALKPSRRFRSRVHSRAGLEATVGLSFASAEGRPLRETLPVRFRARRLGGRAR